MKGHENDVAFRFVHRNVVRDLQRLDGSPFQAHPDCDDLADRRMRRLQVGQDRVDLCRRVKIREVDRQRLDSVRERERNNRHDDPVPAHCCLLSGTVEIRSTL